MGSFKGIYDNLFIDGNRYNLWKTIDFSGIRLYAAPKSPSPKTANGTVISFYGNGYLKQRVGMFQVSGMYSEVRLDFRCLMDNVVIFGVTGKTGSFVYGLYIFGGRLMFQFATSLGNNNAIVTTRYLQPVIKINNKIQ